ncbi:disks large-associated protein 2 isoform X3, partial [Tachysurus ichikawai]
VFRYTGASAGKRLMIPGLALWSDSDDNGASPLIPAVLHLHAFKSPLLSVTYTPSTPTYKRTPPPVPPRSASKPLISITAQSSTESTQDAYHEERLARGGLWGSDGLGLGLVRTRYNSTDSLDSAKAVTIAMEAAAMAMAGKRHPSTDSHSSVLTCDKAILVSKAEEYLKTPRSSIGIQ